MIDYSLRNKRQESEGFNGYLDTSLYLSVKRNTVINSTSGAIEEEKLGDGRQPNDMTLSEDFEMIDMNRSKNYNGTYDEEDKYQSEDSQSSDTSVTFYDALDHIIYDEFKKEVCEENKRRQTEFILDHKRTTLPALRPKSSINIFKILKDSIGKDLTKFCVPVYFNEPISMLQKVAEIMQFEHLVSTAAEQTDQLKRLAYVTGFCIAQYGGTQFRCSKPFNPVLGETFELKSQGWKFISEQVSHHPPISAGYVEHEKYEMWMNTHMKTKFWGKSLEFRPLGYQHFRFKDTDDHIV